MKFTVTKLSLALAFTAFASASLARPPTPTELAKGEYQVVYAFENPEGLAASTEGIALDFWGNKYISYRAFDAATNTFVENKLLRIDRKGRQREVADFGAAEPGCLGILGLTTDRWGNIYAAVMSGNDTHGVWAIHPIGWKMKLDGSDQIYVPNALTFDRCGNLYVTDSFPIDPEGPGLVWRYTRREREFKVWASSDLLAPDPINDPLSPPWMDPPLAAPGANGIAFVPPNNIYVANSEKSLILHIPVTRQGEAGEVDIVTGTYPPAGPPGLLFGPDGLAADDAGNIYTVLPAAGLTRFPVSPVLKIDPSTGALEPIVTPLVVPTDPFNFSTSLAVGKRHNEGDSVFVVGITAQVYGIPTDPPKIVQVGIAD